MRHATASTSRNHYKHFDASSLYGLIIAKMREDAEKEWCIADIAHALDLERSTVSGRMHELKEFGVLEFTGEKPSKRTKVKAKHYRLTVQPTLL